jgi:DNA-binding NtrC family response regulator
MVPRLTGRPVLIVEDEYLIGLDLCRTFELAGALPFLADGIGGALEIIDREPIVVAVLDLRLADGDCEPVCRALNKKGIPFLIHTGALAMPVHCKGAAFLRKPANPQTVYATVVQMLEAAASPTGADVTAAKAQLGDTSTTATKDGTSL